MLDIPLEVKGQIRVGMKISPLEIQEYAAHVDPRSGDGVVYVVQATQTSIASLCLRAESNNERRWLDPPP